MSKREIPDEVREKARLELARKHYRYYLPLVHHGNYIPLKHTELIANELQKIIDGEQRHIIIEMPPRMGKSMSVTETFPSYFLGRFPNKKVITAAYSDSLARNFGRLNRNKFLEFAPQVFSEAIADDNGSVADWSVLDNTGGMVSTGIGGSITGKGADLLCIDDPLKNAKEAQSQTIRDTIWQEWESTLSTRLHKGASVIVIMTRWHEDDFVGRLLENSPYNWTRLRLPAVAEDDDDLLGRDIGETLSPELGFDKTWAENKKIEVGSRTWASLYQQRPAPSEGSIFKRQWFNYVDTAPYRHDDIVMSWDFTFSDTTESDYVVGQVWKKQGADFYLIDQIRDQIDFTQSVRAVVNLKKKHPRCRTILIEDKANGPAIINTLRKEVSGIVPIKPRESKVARANAITPYFEAQNVHILNSLPHLNDMIEEWASFPNSKNDDTVDAMTQALNYFAEKPANNIFTTSPW
ncbi:phage terminase large subunit [Staphylococcus pettenkoferi]|uniref:phage terminase large subunit n=1 Tax=Staphylococcus pettenkoferi TaxID=170573 RepID=UPI00227468F8|nr:phage terminase large subunit [Staphylococcus pettenkoferi]MCY1563829.1 phage terminase large subunit [Staphylococcus pettenkoferi]